MGTAAAVVTNTQNNTNEYFPRLVLVTATNRNTNGVKNSFLHFHRDKWPSSFVPSILFVSRCFHLTMNKWFLAYFVRRTHSVFCTFFFAGGQPMTLSVGGTVFCFRAVLMGGDLSTTTTVNNTSWTTASTDTASTTATPMASGSNHNNSSTSNGSSAMDHLVLFSVVIALAPQIDHISSIPISGWFDATFRGGTMRNEGDHGDLTEEEDGDHASHPTLHRVRTSSGGAASDTKNSCQSSHNTVNSHNAIAEEESHRAKSASFLAIRRVQISLARLCRVLEREEKRCRYISLQAQQIFEIRAALIKSWEGASGGSGFSKSNNSNTKSSNSTTSTKPSSAKSLTAITSSNSPKSSSAAGISATKPPPKGSHRRGNSFSTGLLIAATTSSAGTGGGAGTVAINDVTKDNTGTITSESTTPDTTMQQEEQEQEILENILAAGLQDGDPKIALNAGRQYGNLGRELVQVFHALSRNDHNFPPSPSVLSGRDGVVYVNRHIALAIEPVSLPTTLPSMDIMDSKILRPYHTLLFPNASPLQLLQSLQSSGFTAPLQQLLLTVRPSKPLMDIAVDANLPLATTMELSNYMVAHGACVASTVLTRASRLACKRVERIQALALDFSQTFDDWSVNLFVIVSFLTMDCRALGESMSSLTTGDDAIGSSLRTSILSYHEDDTDNFVFVDDADDSAYADALGVSNEDHEQHHQVHPRAEELEEVLYSMAIWLLSHQVLGQIQDYLVLADNHVSMPVTNWNPTNGKNPPSSLPDRKIGGNESVATETSRSFDEGLLRELQDSECLTGTTSLLEISWRLGLDEAKLRSWALNQDRIRVISRLAASGDDWGAV